MPLAPCIAHVCGIVTVRNLVVVVYIVIVVIVVVVIVIVVYVGDDVGDCCGRDNNKGEEAGD